MEVHFYFLQFNSLSIHLFQVDFLYLSKNKNKRTSASFLPFPAKVLFLGRHCYWGGGVKAVLIHHKSLKWCFLHLTVIHLGDMIDEIVLHCYSYFIGKNCRNGGEVVLVCHRSEWIFRLVALLQWDLAFTSRNVHCCTKEKSSFSMIIS